MAIKRHYKVNALILLEAYKNSYWLITKLTSYFGMHSGSDKIANCCWTPCYYGSLHFRNNQINKLLKVKMLKLEAYPDQFQWIVHSRPYILLVYNANCFWESTNENANLSLGTAIGFSNWCCAVLFSYLNFKILHPLPHVQMSLVCTECQSTVYHKISSITVARYNKVIYHLTG